MSVLAEGSPGQHTLNTVLSAYSELIVEVSKYFSAYFFPVVQTVSAWISLLCGVKWQNELYAHSANPMQPVHGCSIQL